MAFAEWKKRSEKYQDTMKQNGIGRIDAEQLAQAAYKAGERDGRKAAESAARSAILMREILRKT